MCPGPLSAILAFLAEEFANGKQYRTINSYRSVISMTHNPINGVVIGKHPLVSRLLKGVYNMRPPKPRYSFTWDVKIVLDYLRSWGPTASLSLKKLTQKLVMLLALANASRSSELHALSTSSMIWGSQGVMFTRGAAVSAARLHGMSVADIVSVADWTSDTMFKKFYYRPVAESKKSLLPFVIDSK